MNFFWLTFRVAPRSDLYSQNFIRKSREREKKPAANWSLCTIATLKPINESTHAKYDGLMQQIFPINQSMLVTFSTNDNGVRGVFNNFFEAPKLNGGVFYSIFRPGYFSFYRLVGECLKPGLTRIPGLLPSRYLSPWPVTSMELRLICIVLTWLSFFSRFFYQASSASASSKKTDLPHGIAVPAPYSSSFSGPVQVAPQAVTAAAPADREYSAVTPTTTSQVVAEPALAFVTTLLDAAGETGSPDCTY